MTTTERSAVLTVYDRCLAFTVQFVFQAFALEFTAALVIAHAFNASYSLVSLSGSMDLSIV